MKNTEKLLSDITREYLMDLKIENKSPRTIETYGQHLKEFFNFLVKNNCPVNIQAINVSMIREFLNEKIAHIYVVHSRYRSLNAFFNWCIRQEYATSNPISFLKAPKLPDKVIPTVSPDQIKALLDSFGKDFLGKRNRAIVIMFLDTGIRLDELTNITLNDVDIENGLLRIVKGKGNKQRIVSFGDTTKKALWAYLKGRESTNTCLWLTEEKNKQLSQHGIQIFLNRAGKELGFTCNPHKWRHTFATSMIRGKENIFNVQTLLGHKSIAMVKRYSKTLNQDDAIEAQRRASPADRMI